MPVNAAGRSVSQVGVSPGAAQARSPRSLPHPQIQKLPQVRQADTFARPADNSRLARAVGADSGRVAVGGAHIAVYAASRSLGAPVDNGGGVAAHDWDGLVVQDFAGGADTEGRALVVDGDRGTFLVRNDFYRRYLEGTNHVALGAPTSEERWESGAVVQSFERGTMRWTPGSGTTVELASASPAPAADSGAAARIGAYASRRDLGPAVDNGGGASAHGWDVGTVQDFAGGKDTNGRAMVVDSGAGTFLVRNDFYAHYLEGDTHLRLGAPTSDERWENGAVVQDFERGRMTWSPGAGTRVDAPDGPGPAPAVRPEPVEGSDLGDLVEGLYQRLLGRTASGDPGSANWVGFASSLRAQGRSDGDVERTLTAMIEQSDEYRRKHAGPVVTPPKVTPVGAPGSVYAPFEVAPGASVNGRLGIHWPSTLGDTNLGRADQIIASAKALGAGYATVLVDPAHPEWQQPLLAKLLGAGLTPVVRLYNASPPDRWTDAEIGDMANAAVALGRMGVKLVHVGNEPNLDSEAHLDTGNGLRMDRDAYNHRSARRQAEAMLTVRRTLDANGLDVKLGLPPVAAGAPDSGGNSAPQTYFPVLVDEVARLERESGTRVVDWLATHTYTMGQPGTDGPSQMGASSRGQLGWGPETSNWYEAEARRALGRDVSALSTEGGAEPNAFRSSDGLVRAQMDEALGQLRGDRTLTNALWLLYDDAGMASGAWGKWDKFALTDGEALWHGGLDAYRDAFRNR